MTAVAARLPAAPFRLLWPRFTQKRMAAAFRISVITARDWLRDGLPAARRAEMRRVILAECDRLDAELRRLREDG